MVNLLTSTCTGMIDSLSLVLGSRYLSGALGIGKTTQIRGSVALLSTRKKSYQEKSGRSRSNTRRMW